MYLVRKQIGKEFADNPRCAEAFVLLSANGQNQAKLYNRFFTTKSFANKAALANNKKK